MVSLVLAALLSTADVGIRAAGPETPPAATGDVRAVLARERYPWYDAQRDRLVPVLPSPDFGGRWWKSVGRWFSDLFAPLGRWLRGLNTRRIPGIGGLGDAVAIGLAMLLLTVVLVALMELLRRYRRVPIDDVERLAAAQSVRTARIEGLPAGDRLNLADPWAEAQRLRALGDLAGAVVHLFAHQILTLVRIRQLRPLPGRTGRQLVRSVPDRALRATVEPTLRLFEQVYYGHQTPTTAAFDPVWAEAEAFNQRADAVATEGA